MNQKKFFIFFGPPGSGKGTQAQMFAKKINLPIISTGEMLRQELKQRTKLGLKIEKLMSEGKYVSDKIAGELIVGRLDDKDATNGAIFDGYPRTKPQQKFLVDLLESQKAQIIAILVDVTDEEVMRRQGGRRVCINGHTFHIKFNQPKITGTCNHCGQKLFVRDDDKPEAVKVRLGVYHQKTEVLLKHWEDINELIVLDGEQDIKVVQSDLGKRLKKNKLI
jgi:adenylate kinase